jgi:hypothetical protein
MACFQGNKLPLTLINIHITQEEILLSKMNTDQPWVRRLPSSSRLSGDDPFSADLLQLLNTCFGILVLGIFFVRELM